MSYYVVYYILIAAAFFQTVFLALKGDHRCIPLSVLLFVTLFMEIGAHFLIFHEIDFTWTYHLYSPLEYGMLCFFIMSGIKKKTIVTAIKLSVVAFAVVSWMISYFFYHFKNMPGINVGIEGFLLASVSIYRLFNLDMEEDDAIVFIPDFWICIGLLMFFSITSFFFGIYTPLFSLSKEDALYLFGIIVRPLNILLYLFIIVGLLCSIRKMKYSLQ